MWTAVEDRILVDCLVSLRMDQKFMADSGFKAGYANALQKMIEEKLPGCGIKATPHITSRLKMLKRLWQAAYDIVYEPNTSGFGWNSETNLVTADPEVWDEYLKAHPKAKEFRTKPLPNFDSLCMVWGRDRATGEEGECPGGMEEQVNLEDDKLPETPQNVVDESELSQTNHETVPTQVNASDAYVGPKKKRKLNNAEVIAEALRDTITQLDKTIVTAFDKLGNMMAPQERQPKPATPGDDLYMELLQLEELTWNERNLAHMKILACDKMHSAFVKVPTQFKPSWIRTLLNQ